MFHGSSLRNKAGETSCKSKFSILNASLLGIICLHNLQVYILFILEWDNRG